MAFDEKAKHAIYKQQESAKELAAEFRQAIAVAQLERLLPQERTCDWCGIDLHTVDDHKIVDRQYMCNPCVDQLTVSLGSPLLSQRLNAT